MSNEPESGETYRLINAIAGGWVADAASLGLHWLYSSERIREVGGDAPEFLPPSASYFEGGFGYFAHAGKVVGDTSHYAAATRVLTDSLLANQGRLVVRDYQRRFRAFFGPGGDWQGYIDNPTRITLDNLTANEKAAIEQARSDTTVNLTAEQRRVLVQKVLPYTRKLSGDALAEPVRRAISLTYESGEVQEAGVLIARSIDERLVPESGADDMQLPAVSKLPPLVACYLGRSDLLAVVEAAVRVTNHNDHAVAWTRCAAVLLEQIYRGIPVGDALEAAINEAPEPDTIKRARDLPALDPAGAGDSFGRTCYLNEALPVIGHILTHAGSFTEAVRANIQCGGDSCGRAWIIGPVMAAVHGVGGEQGIPLSWLARVRGAASHCTDIETLVTAERQLGR